MTELFAELPEEIKRKSELIVDFVLTNFNAEQGMPFLTNYINTCTDEEEKNFIIFYLSLRLEQIVDENNNDKR